jgi:hypothetical protein
MKTDVVVIRDVTPELLANIEALVEANKNECTCTTDPDGSKGWYKYGKLHRDGDLPAVEYPNGTKKWFKNGVLHRDNDLPAVEYPNGTKKWFVGGECTRANGKPAITYSNGRREWWFNNVRQTEIYPRNKFVVIYNGKREDFFLD